MDYDNNVIMIVRSTRTSYSIWIGDPVMWPHSQWAAELGRFLPAFVLRSSEEPSSVEEYVINF